MSAFEEVTRVLEATSSQAQKTLYFSALLNREAKLKDELIVVGGSAIEIYTRGAYVSGDIDVIGMKENLESILRAWGFTKSGRIWWSARLKIALDIVRSDGYTGSEARLRKLVTPYGPIRVAAIEDLIIGRLASTKHWRLPKDLDDAVLLVKDFESSPSSAPVEA